MQWLEVIGFAMGGFGSLASVNLPFGLRSVSWLSARGRGAVIVADMVWINEEYFDNY